MDTLKKRYKKEYGSIEPYIVLKMQIAVILALIISVLGVVITPNLHMLNTITLVIVLHSLIQIRENFKEKMIKYTAIFGVMYLIAIVIPIVFLRRTISISPTSLDMILLVLISLLALLFIMKLMITKKGVKGEVILADKETAVIKVNYDLMTGIKPGKYAVDNKGAKKGDKVKVSLSKIPFQKPSPQKIKEIIK